MNKIELVENLKNKKEILFSEIGKNIIGQKDIIDYLFISILCKGHVLLEGVPGLAKTLLIKTLSDALELKFNRIQFTPDLMPSDITGTEIVFDVNILLIISSIKYIFLNSSSPFKGNISVNIFLIISLLKC